MELLLLFSLYLSTCRPLQCRAMCPNGSATYKFFRATERNTSRADAIFLRDLSTVLAMKKQLYVASC